MLCNDHCSTCCLQEFRCALGDQCCQNIPAETGHSKLSSSSKGNTILDNGDLNTSSKGSSSLDNGDLNKQDHLTNGYKDSDSGHADRGCSSPGGRCCQGRSAGRTPEQSDVDNRNVANGVNGEHGAADKDGCCVADENNCGTCRSRVNLANIEVSVLKYIVVW